MPEKAAISAEVVNRLIYGFHDRQRFTQETPVLPEVWQAFAANPKARHDLLITPNEDRSALSLLRELIDGDADGLLRKQARLAPLQSFVAAKLCFAELLSHILPLTGWAADAYKAVRRLGAADFPAIAFRSAYESALEPEGRAVIRSRSDGKTPAVVLRGETLDAARMLTLAALIEAAGEGGITLPLERIEQIGPAQAAITTKIELFLARLPGLLDRAAGHASIWRIANNRPIKLAVNTSRATSKADAAYRVFDIKCEKICWAVLDCGIDTTHPAFLTDKNDPASTRVERTYGFDILRALLDVGNDPPGAGKSARSKALETACARANLDPDTGKALLANVHQSFGTEMLDWSSIEPLLRIVTPDTPADGHGTHVAGIIGADHRDDADEPILLGMCPDIRLCDMRIISDGDEDTEFAVIAALQLIGYLNSHNQYIVVHGANLSLAIPHVVESYACGRTPVCNECERLVRSGVTVVSAAGNNGYQRFNTEKGPFPSYATVSITDPGNADSVITVGATHKRDPHTYGISYFSSRGPTGDGRMKPDLVAPGERIESTLPGGETGSLDGTSQAAPHVSAAAAMLMARYPEINRQPARIKQILCDTATDLGRERAFQGNGMLDVLRALQSY